MSARRAVWRWAWRMFRKDWRDQSLILGLVAGAVALSVTGALLLYHVTPSELAADSRSSFTLDGEPAEVERAVAGFGDDVGAMQQGWSQIPGAIDTINVRAFDPAQPALDGTLALLDGTLPTGPGQAAVTNGVEDVALVRLGDTVELDGIDLTIVGLVENPADLGDEFVYLDHRQSSPLTPQTAFFTNRSIDDVVGDFRGGVNGSEYTSPRTLAKIASAVATTLAMMLVGLIVSASFGVTARRRVRQYGLLGAIGANERHLRGAAAFNGFVVGTAAASVGALAGITVAWLLLPLLEDSLNHRVDFTVPISTIGWTLVVAVVMSTIAAWWPARAIASQPVVEALAARRPRSRSVNNTTVAGAASTLAGYGLLIYAAREQRTFPAIIAVVLAVIGVLLLTPAVISIIGWLASRTPLSARIAGRDLARFQSRAAAALGAIVLALAIPVGVGVVTASVDARAETEPRNLADDAAIVWGPGTNLGDDEIVVPEGYDPSVADESLARVKAEFSSITVTPIEALYDPSAEPWAHQDGPPIVPVQRSYAPASCMSVGNISGFSDDTGQRCYRARQLWVATPELLELWSIESDDEAETITSQTEPFLIWDTSKDETAPGDPLREPTSVVAPLPDYASFSSTLVAEHAIDPAHQRVVVGWILTNPTPFEPGEVERLRDAMSGGAVVETLSTPSSNAGARTIAAGLGMLVGFAILAATVTLIRGESSDDARVLDVLGASGRVRRGVAGATAGYLAFGGAVLAIPLGFLGLIVARSGQTGLPIVIPWSTLLVLFVAFPLFAALASGLFSTTPRELR